jgi:hypothetical protein
VTIQSALCAPLINYNGETMSAHTYDTETPQTDAQPIWLEVCCDDCDEKQNRIDYLERQLEQLGELLDSLVSLTNNQEKA